VWGSRSGVGVGLSSQIKNDTVDNILLVRAEKFPNGGQVDGCLRGVYG